MGPNGRALSARIVDVPHGRFGLNARRKGNGARRCTSKNAGWPTGARDLAGGGFSPFGSLRSGVDSLLRRDVYSTLM